MKSVEERLELLREFTECPQTGSHHYGKYGTLNVEQRLFLHKLAVDALELIQSMDCTIRLKGEKE